MNLEGKLALNSIEQSTIRSIEREIRRMGCSLDGTQAVAWRKREYATVFDVAIGDEIETIQADMEKWYCLLAGRN
jgi:hypothetical protein